MVIGLMSQVTCGVEVLIKISEQHDDVLARQDFVTRLSQASDL